MRESKQFEETAQWVAGISLAGDEPELMDTPGFEPGPDPMIGQQLGNFRITEFLGKGGFGAVYRANQIYLDEPVAIKVLKLEHQTNDAYLKWHHVISTYSGASTRELKLYINGQLRGTETNTFTGAAGGSYPFTIGCLYHHGRFNRNLSHFFGAIDEVVVYDKVLTPQDVSQRYQSTRPASHQIHDKIYLAGVDKKLYVIDPTTYAVTRTSLSVSAAPIALDRSGATLYLADLSSPKIHVMDTRTLKLGSSATPGQLSGFATLAPDGLSLWSWYKNPEILSTQPSLQPKKKLLSVSSGHISDVALLAKKGMFAAMSYGERKVYFFDLKTQTLQQTLSLSQLLGGITASPDGTKIYVSYNHTNQIESYDTSTLKKLDAYTTPNKPALMVMHPNGKEIFFLIDDPGKVYVLDLSTKQTSTLSINVAYPSYRMYLHHGGKKLFVQSADSGEIHAIDLQTKSLLKTIKLGVKTALPPGGAGIVGIPHANSAY